MAFLGMWMWELRISCALPLHQRGKCVSEGTCTLNRKPGCGNKGSELRASLRAHRLEVRLIISERSIPSNPSYRRCEATTESSKVARHPVSPKPSDPSPRPQTRNPNGSKCALFDIYPPLKNTSTICIATSPKAPPS